MCNRTPFILIIFLFLSTFMLPVSASAQEQDLSAYKEALSSRRNGGCGFFTGVPAPVKPSCNGFSDGQACITITDGVGPFQYIWVGSTSTTNCRSNVGAGTYTVIVIDQGQGGTSCSFDVFVNEPASIAVFNMNPVPPSCFGLCDGQANPIVIGGNGGNMFSYSSGETTQAAFMLCNPFTLTITDSKGCTEVVNYAYLNEPPPIVISGIVTNQQCSEVNDGAMDVTVSGGTNSYTYAWTGPGGYTNNIADILGLAPGTYTLTVTDSNTCQNTASFQVMPTTPIVSSALIVDVICAGEATGAIDHSTSGGAENYLFEWSGPNGFTVGTEDIIDLFAGTYTIEITDANLCIHTAQYVVDEDDPILLTAVVTDLTCFGNPTGAIDLTVMGTFPVSSYLWSGPNSFTASTQGITGLFEGMYTVVVENSVGCTVDSTFTVNTSPEIILTAVIDDLECSGDVDGSIDLEVLGGNGTYGYSWVGPSPFTASTQDISGLLAGAYTVTVTDGLLCQVDSTFNIMEPDPLAAVETITDVECNGDATGSIEIVVSGGVAGYTYSWTGPNAFTSADEDIFNLEAGPYLLTLTDANGCVFTQTYTVDEPTAMVIDAVVTDLLCAMDGTGAIDITVTEGTPTYTYSWTGPNSFTAITPNITGLQAGSYTVVVTDFNGCILTETYVVDEPDALVLTETHIDISCFAANNGSIDLTISGGSGSETIAWTAPGGFTSSSEDLTNLGPNDFTVVVTDVNGCSSTLTVTIEEPLAITIVGSITHVACAGGTTGAINITVSNGTPIYAFAWTGPNGFTSVAEDLTGLAAGMYTVIVTDDNGCSRTASYTVIQNQPILVTAIITHVSCNAASTGAIDITVSGGQSLYQVSWTGPAGYTANTQDITGLATGTYTVTITDALLCTASFDFTVNQAAPLVITAVTSDPDCATDSNGSIDITVTGGTTTYSYSWTGPLGFIGTMEDLINSPGGTYTVTITDFLGCTIQGTYILTQPTEIVVDLDIMNPSCDMTDGSVTANVTGGTVAADYQYEWYDSMNTLLSSTNSVSGLPTGNYLFIVTDDNGCDNTQFFELSDATGFVTAVITNVTCLGDVDGAINITIGDLVQPWTVSWAGPNGYTSIQEDISSLIAGAYTVTIIDALGCTLIQTFTVNAPPPLNLSAAVTHVTCAGEMNGSINLSVQGGFGDKVYAWTGPNGFTAITQDISGLAPGDYSVTVTDGNNCQATANFTVNPAVNYQLTAVITHIQCAGQTNGAIDLSVTPAIGTATYQWNGPDGFNANTQDLTGLNAGTYNVVMTTPAGCIFNASFTVTAPTAITVSTALTPSACGMSIGAATLTASGGTVAADYVYSIVELPSNAPVSNTNSASGLDGGMYGYTVTDDNGCVYTGSFVISDSVGDLTAAISHVTCAGAQDGAIDITVTGLATPLTVQWNGPNGFSATTQNITGLSPGLYTVSVTGANGCVLGDTYEVLPAAGIIVTAVVTQVSCAGNSNGAINMSHAGGVPTFTYAWTGPNGFTAITQDLTNLGPGTYSVTVTDGDLCTGTGTFTVTQPLPISVNEFITGIICDGDSTGAINIEVIGGNGGNIFFWSGPGTFTSSFEDISGLASGMYDLLVTDSKGCVYSNSYFVPQSPAIAITLVQITPANCGLSNGSIQVNASGGAGGYSYVWTNSASAVVGNSATASSLPVGSYTVTVTDANLCTRTAQFSVTSLEATLSAAISAVSCFGFSDGAIDVTVTGVLTGPVDTMWTGSGGFTSSSEDISGLIAGAYTITLSDSIGCIISEQYTVPQPPPISSPAIITHVSCNGTNDGEININVTGGTGTATGSWTGPNGYTANTLDIINLFAGTYTVTLTDANDCVHVQSYVVNQPAGIIANEDITHVLCNGDNTGAIDINPSGGVGTPTYHWTGPNGFDEVTQDIMNLLAGTYDVDITDANDCVQTFSFEVLESPLIVIDLVQLNNANCGLSNGSIEVLAVGGDDNLSYEWSNSSLASVGSGVFVDGLPVDIYTVTVTDGNLCIMTADFEIENMDISVTGQVTDVSCFGLDDGAIEVTIVGAFIGPVDTLWTGPSPFTASSEDLANLFAGTYTLTLSDSVGCVINESFDVMEPEQLVADGTITGNLCFSDSTGSIISNVTGGTEAYGYAWTGPGVFASMDPDIFDLIPGTYDLTVTDDHGCEATYQGILVEPALIIPMETLTNPSCIGNEDGSILLDMTGGTGTLTYVWTGPGTFMSMDEDITGLGPGGYQVEITDDNSCAVEADYVLIALQVMAFSATSVNIDCNGNTNGSIDIEVSGGLETYGYSWIGPVPFTAITQDIADLLAGEYEVLITDQNGCELDTLITLTEPETLIAAEQSVVDLNCNGDLSGAISLDISGGTLDYTLLWSGPNDFTSIEEDISGLEAGDYVLDVIDFNGCALSLPFIVYEPAAISIISTSITDAICENSPDGSIDVDISGGVPGYETSWSGPNGFSSTNEDLTGILPGTYTLSVTDDHGCIESVPFTVAYQLEILADAGTYDPICNGNQVFLDGSNSSGAQSYNWTLLSGLSLSNQVTTNVQASTANSVVILTITNGFCIDRDTLNLDILLLPIVNAGEDQTTFLGEQVTLGGDPTADDAASYNWFPPQLLDDSSHPNPIYVNSGTQTFSVTVVGNNGCIASDDVIITLDPSIEIPDGFTPNGDQVNDVWVLGNRGLFPNLVAQIFSRWGDELFKSAPGYPDPWNGEFNNAPLPVGTYYYIIELNDPKFPDAVTGPLTIFR